MAIELFAAVVPLAATAALLWRRRVAVGASLYAAVATAGALAGQAALHLTCPVRTAGEHLFVFHTGGILLAALVGALVARVPALRASA